MPPRISILIPHFQTLKLTQLCLSLLRQHTNAAEVQTIVIDNGSTDGSGEEIRKLPGIDFLRREVPAGERPARSHGIALNLGLRHATAPLVLTMHTDTMVLRPDWLDYLCAPMKRPEDKVAIVGSWKMETEGVFRRAGKWLEKNVRRMRGRGRPVKKYARSHCALYRREAIDLYPRGFDPADDHTAGEELHAAIVAAGHHCVFLPPADLGKYVRHLNHATMALNAHFGSTDRYMPRTRARAIRRIESFFATIHADARLPDGPQSAS